MKETVDARRLRPATAEQAPSYKGLSLTQMLEAAEKLYEQATESLMPYALRREKQRSRVMQETLGVKNPRRIDDLAKLLKQFNYELQITNDPYRYIPHPAFGILLIRREA